MHLYIYRCIISNFYIYLNTAAGPNATFYTFKLRKNSVDTGLNITIIGNNSSGVNLINTVNFKAGDFLSTK